MALAIADYKKKHKIKIPMVVRFTGFNQIKAYKILEKAGIHPVKTMEEAVKKVVSL
jgi:succinyl-CoA synthetase beta subunit